MGWILRYRFARPLTIAGAGQGGGAGPELGCLIVTIFHFVLREGSVRREGGGEVSVYFCNIKTSHELILLISIIFFCNFYNVLPFILISFSQKHDNSD